MRFAIVGAGAMGSVFGGHLALAGHDVTLVDVRRDHIDAVNRDGLIMRSPDGASRTIPIAATADPGTLQPVDAVIVLVKSFATADATSSIAHALTPETWVATLQNGLGNDAALAAILGPERVVPGTTTVGAEQHGAGETTMVPGTARGESLTQLGRPRGATTLPDGVRALARTLTDAGLPAEALESADTALWTKLALGTMGPVTALLRRTVSDAAADPHAMSLLREMFEEIVAVAKALDVPMDRDATLRHQREAWDAAGPHISSMAADVLAHRRTEIDAFCGEVTRLGEQCSVPTPVNRTVWGLIRAIESSYDGALPDRAA